MEFELPPPGEYAIGMIFHPTSEVRRYERKVVFTKVKYYFLLLWRSEF